jgi:hypothetical protein
MDKVTTVETTTTMAVAGQEAGDVPMYVETPTTTMSPWWGPPGNTHDTTVTETTTAVHVSEVALGDERHGYMAFKSGVWCGPGGSFNAFATAPQTAHDPSLKSLDACLEVCSADHACHFVLYRDQPGQEHCATWPTCPNPTPYIGGDGHVFVWQKHIKANAYSSNQLYDQPAESQSGHGSPSPAPDLVARAQRRLSVSSDSSPMQEPQMATESDRFTVSFDSSALTYNVDEALIQKLIDRNAFWGLRDGREHERGEARIIGFKIHRPVFQNTLQEKAAITGSFSAQHPAVVHQLPVLMAAVAGVFLIALVAVRFAKSSLVRRQEYAKLDSDVTGAA